MPLIYFCSSMRISINRIIWIDSTFWSGFYSFVYSSSERCFRGSFFLFSEQCMRCWWHVSTSKTLKLGIFWMFTSLLDSSVDIVWFWLLHLYCQCSSRVNGGRCLRSFHFSCKRWSCLLVFFISHILFVYLLTVFQRWRFAGVFVQCTQFSFCFGKNTVLLCHCSGGYMPSSQFFLFSFIFTNLEINDRVCCNMEWLRHVTVFNEFKRKFFVSFQA